MVLREREEEVISMKSGKKSSSPIKALGLSATHNIVDELGVYDGEAKEGKRDGTLTTLVRS